MNNGTMKKNDTRASMDSRMTIEAAFKGAGSGEKLTSGMGY